MDDASLGVESSLDGLVRGIRDRRETSNGIALVLRRAPFAVGLALDAIVHVVFPRLLVTERIGCLRANDIAVVLIRGLAPERVGKRGQAVGRVVLVDRRVRAG